MMSLRNHTAGHWTLWAGIIALAFFAAVTTGAEKRIEIDLSGPGWHLWRDETAAWKTDPLFFPVPSLEELPVNPPTGGWTTLESAPAVKASVPGTVEEYLQKIPGPEGDLTGVSWWFRTVMIPRAASGQRVLLRFESIRQRADVFVNRRLAGYDVVGNSPFELDITSFVTPGASCEIAIRITDPGGNFDWRDSQAMRWGAHMLPLSHGFGGITGRVRLVLCEPVYIEDIYVQNTPAITEVNALVTVRNTTGAPVHRALEASVKPRGNDAGAIFRTTVDDVSIAPGDTVVPVKIRAPKAQL
jgi:beta-galactosidase